jgi:hypothetical protein
VVVFGRDIVTGRSQQSILAVYRSGLLLGWRFATYNRAVGAPTGVLREFLSWELVCSGQETGIKRPGFGGSSVKTIESDQFVVIYYLVSYIYCDVAAFSWQKEACWAFARAFPGPGKGEALGC